MYFFFYGIFYKFSRNISEISSFRMVIYPDMERWLFFIRLKIDYFETISNFFHAGKTENFKNNLRTLAIGRTGKIS